MTTAIDQIRVNGNVYSWGSITAYVGDTVITGLTSISYGDKRTRVKQYGMGRHHAPRGRSRGKYEIDNCKVGGPKSTLQALRQALANESADGISYGDVEFQFNVEYIEADEAPIFVEIERCVWAVNSSSEEENPDPLKEEAEFDPMLIRRNGLVLCDASEGMP